MNPEARRRSVSEKAFISIPIGIVVLLLIVIPLSLILYRRRSRRSRLVSGNPVDLVAEIPTVSLTSVVSQAMERNKELPQTPQTAQIVIDIRADPSTSSHDDDLNRATKEKHRVRPMTLPSSRNVENLATVHLQRASLLNMSTSPRPVPSSSRNELRVLNLTDEDTFYMDQSSTPRSCSPQTLVEKQGQTHEKDYPYGSKMEKKDLKPAGDPSKNPKGPGYFRNTFQAPLVKKNTQERRLSTPTFLPLPGRATVNDRKDTKVVQELAPKYSVQSQLQTSKLAINIPVYPIYPDPNQRSAFCDMMPEKGPETALPPYSSPGNGHTLRLSMFT